MSKDRYYICIIRELQQRLQRDVPNAVGIIAIEI